MKKIIDKYSKGIGSYFATKKCEANLIKANGLFSIGNYAEAGKLYKELIDKSDNFIAKGDLDRVISTFIKLGDTEAIEKLLPRLLDNYSIFNSKYSILSLVVIYDQLGMVSWLAQKGLLEKELEKKDVSGRSVFETAIIHNNGDFFTAIQDHLPSGFDPNKFLNRESARKIMEQMHLGRATALKIDGFYLASIKNEQQQFKDSKCMENNIDDFYHVKNQDFQYKLIGDQPSEDHYEVDYNK